MTDNQAKRVHAITYSCDDREDLAKRIVGLEDIAADMLQHIKQTCSVCDEDFCSSWDEDNECCGYESDLRELGVEVDS